MIGRRAAIAAIGLTLAAGTVSAQAILPPYAPQMERLGEILGSLHFLSGLCEAAASPWRDAMTGLLLEENPHEAFRLRIIDRFNIGYSSFAAVYQRCTPAAEEAMARYRAEGIALIATVTQEFGTATEPASVPPAGSR